MPGWTRRELLSLAAGAAVASAGESEKAVFLSLDDARPALEAFSSDLPAGLPAKPGAAQWLNWEAAHDREIRARLERGDADSIINFILFGTSFTREPRLSDQHSDADDAAVAKLILARVRDFAAVVVHPGTNERLQFAAAWLKANGVDFAAVAADKRIEVVVLENCRRVLREQRQYKAVIDDAKRTGDGSGLFRARSTLYRERGLSLDTSFRPNFAIERALAEMKSAGALRRVRQAAVIGPGLDFTDKRGGYDFYPVQTMQPFALIDSLRRLGLADHMGPRVWVFDLSERVLSHMRRAAVSPYIIQLPLDGATRWLPETVAYWQHFGEEIGEEVKAATPPPDVDVRMRAVRVRPDTVALLRPASLDIVTQHEPFARDEKVDLVIATNVLVYYSQFEQALAQQNISCMLSAGGMLLSNNVLPDANGLFVTPAGTRSVPYSEDPDDGDHVLWYRHI